MRHFRLMRPKALIFALSLLSLALAVACGAAAPEPAGPADTQPSGNTVTRPSGDIVGGGGQTAGAAPTAPSLKSRQRQPQAPARLLLFPPAG